MEHLSMQHTAHVPQQSIDEQTSIVGLRAIATLEALKGVAILMLMLVFFGVHKQAEDIAENLLYHLHIDPDRHAAQAILHAADKLTDARVWIIALAAISYSTVRFVESWGLWNRRVWAEWFSLLSGALYLPWEILKLVERVTWVHLGVLLTNVAIVLYMLWVRVRSYRHPLDPFDKGFA
jgi:uncharacterized membrane protein (DUF2068 family)